MKKHLPVAAVLLLAGCGGTDASAPLAVERGTSPSDHPAPALAAGTLASIADSRLARTRIGYVNVEATERLRGQLDPLRVRRLVLGDGAARLADASPAPRVAVQIGPSTILQADAREVIGGAAADRERLSATTPDPTLLEDEAQSVVQSCLGDAAAQVIVGPTVMGLSSAVGASLIESSDAPAGLKLKVCAAPRFVRDVDRAERRLHRLFPDAGASEAAHPTIGLIEMGERELVGGAVAVDQVDPALLDELLAGGPALRRIAAPGPAGDPLAESEPHEHH